MGQTDVVASQNTFQIGSVADNERFIRERARALSPIEGLAAMEELRRGAYEGGASPRSKIIFSMDRSSFSTVDNSSARGSGPAARNGTNRLNPKVIDDVTAAAQGTILWACSAAQLGRARRPDRSPPMPRMRRSPVRCLRPLPSRSRHPRPDRRARQRNPQLPSCRRGRARRGTERSAAVLTGDRHDPSLKHLAQTSLKSRDHAHPSQLTTARGDEGLATPAVPRSAANQVERRVPKELRKIHPGLADSLRHP